MKDRIRKVDFKLLALSILMGVSGLLVAFGLGAFLCGGLISMSINYDYTQRLNQPVPICGNSGVIHLNQRLYVFEENQRALNVYKDDGTFLFCVRCENATNGGASVRITEKDIYIYSPNHYLHRFDQNGNYLGFAKNGCVYDRDGYFIGNYQGKLWVFTDDWYSCREYDAETKRGDIYIYSYDGELLSVEDYTNGTKTSENEAQYYTRLNGLYRKQNGEEVLLAKTPLILTFWKSPLKGWTIAVVGAVLWNVTKPRFKAARKQWKQQKSLTLVLP